ncbi:MAG: preprotein translocase subunit YajC [Fibrobacterota bacterium]
MLSLVYAQSSAPTGAPAGAAGLGSILPMMIIIFVVFYFFIIRPQSKKQKETKKLLESIKKGDKVVTIGGILGLVTGVKGNVVTLKIAPDTEVDFKKSAVATVVTPEMEKELKGEK